MIFFVANDGTIIKGMPSPVYQGAANSNTIYLIAPFASNTAVTVAFRLPNGVVTSPAAMTAQNALQGIVNAETGQTYAGWTYDLPNGITEMYGTVTVQFFFYSAEAGVITPTSSTSFEVGRGVPAVLPDTPEDDVYENILSNLAALQTQLNNGSFASRAIYNWNASYTYGAGEVTFYPDIGTYGAFVKSVQAGNTNHAPYTDGAVNSAWWSEVVNFNTVTDDFFAEIKAVQTAAEAAQSAAETAQGKAEDAQAAAEGSAVQAQTNAGEASASATAAAESAAAASGSESAAAEAAGSASKSAEEAAASAGEAASSASSAQAAQAAAEKAKESVEASADAAAKSAESARASATAAGNSATAAAGSAGAAESAKAAAQTAQNAAESAEGNAQAYAGQASGSASAASQSEINARAYMEQAKQYAQKEYQVVASFDDLPRPGDSAYIYLVPSGSGSSNDHYSEYLWISEANDYEFVGAINEVDLSGYAQTNGTYPNMSVGNASNAASAQTAVKATQDAAGNDIAATYAKQTGTYPNMSVGTASEAGYADAAASADTAGYATTAKGDASGNDIEATYAKQTGTYTGMTVGNATQAGSANDPNAVHFTAQTLTDEQKAQARTNIGAADAGTVTTNTSDIADLESDVQKIIDGTTSIAEAAHADTADSATKAAQDAAGNVIADTYAKQQGSYPQMSVGNASNATLASNSNMLGGVAAASYARATGTYSGMSVGYATTAGTATTASRATADASGNNIKDTYATKEEVYFPNLLINPDFKINQRGSSSYNGNPGYYTADRWVLITVGNLYLYDDHLELRSGSLGQYIEQELLPSTQYTLSVSYAISGSTRQTDTVTFTTPASTPTSNTVVGTIRVNTYLSFNVRYYTSPGYYAVTFEKSYPTYVNFYWVKLEQSSTATPFVPPNITTELLKCQRYYYRVPGRFRVLSMYDGSENFVLDTIFFPVQMRTTPTISLTLYRNVNGVSQAIVSGHEESENFVTLWSNSGYSGYLTAECYLYYADAEI